MIRPLLLALSYILLSFASFPGINAGWVAWFSFIPLFAMLERYDSRSRFIVSFILIEWIKWVLLVIWLRHVSWFAVFGIALGFAGYHLAWFLALREIVGKRVWTGLQKLSPLSVVGLACLWSAMEWLRTQPYGLTGAHLCITQWKYPVVLQIASWIGGYGLSGLIVAVNLWNSQFLSRVFGATNLSKFQKLSPILTVMVLLFGILIFGSNRLHTLRDSKTNDTTAVKIAVIQPYCPPYRMWTYDRMTDVIRTTLLQSQALGRRETLDFMVWPEGTLPGSIYPGSAMEREVLDLVNQSIQVPLLFGNQSESDGEIYNSVLACLPGSGIMKERYHKRILVPFGEFIPFREYLGPIETIVPIPQDFSRGDANPIIAIPIGDKDINICSQICYEDCFPQLLLGDDLTEVDLVYVATYNAWYGEEFGAYFHAAHSVIRAVEIARPVLRCGSAGWSGLIDATGTINQTVRDPKTESIYFRGSDVLQWQPSKRISTQYKKYYATLHLLYLICGIGIVAYGYRQQRESRKMKHAFVRYSEE